MRDLVALYPALESTAIVPAGLTKHRDGLYTLTPFSPEECAEVVRVITEFGDACLEQYGTRLFYPSDELYLKAGLPLPEDDFYESYSQIENGVGMLTDMNTDVSFTLEDVDDLRVAFRGPRHVSIATGFAAYAHISAICQRLCAEFDGLSVTVYPIRNDFFGPEITVAGLLTGTDIRAQLSGKALGDALLIPAACLRAEGDVLLDDVSPEELAQALHVSVIPAKSEATAFIRALLGL